MGAKTDASEKLRDEVLDLLKRGVSNPALMRILPPAALGIATAAVINSPLRLSFAMTLPFLPLKALKFQGPGFSISFDVITLRTDIQQALEFMYGITTGDSFPLEAQVLHAALITMMGILAQDFAKALGTAIRENTGDVLEALPL